VADICRRLDGIPLAIELACARIGVLSPGQIAQRLKDSLKLLTAGGRTVTPRHQTLKVTLAWSYELLDEPERKLFEWLSVFMGGWTLEAAETVGTGEGVKEEDVLDLLSRLVDKSLVVAEAGEGEVRYRMLEPIRQYGLERLEQSGNADAARRRHAAFFLALAEEAELLGPRQGEWLERLEMEHDNLRAALSWALGQEEAELGLRLGGALGEFWHLRGYLSEGRLWLQAALAKGEATLTAARARALAQAGYIAWEQGDYAHSVALSEESLTLSRKLGDAAGVAAALYALGWAAMFGNQIERASVLIDEAITLQRAAGDTAGVARSLLILGFVANYRRNYERATALYEESLMLAREAGDGFAIALSLGVGALAALGRGDHRQTKLLCEEGLQTSRRLKMMHLTAAYLHVAASLAGAQGKATRSARLWGAAEALREDIGTVLSPFERDLYGPYLTAAQAQLDEAAWKAAWAGGRAMTTEEAIMYALSDRAVPATVTVPETGETLTSREVEVLILISSGASNQQISEELVLSIHTVKSHVVHILRKLGVSSRTQAAARVRELGVL
jgi:non-specific serine/threonine protein kinase